jgi:hypothetical protein
VEKYVPCHAEDLQHNKKINANENDTRNFVDDE